MRLRIPCRKSRTRKNPLVPDPVIQPRAQTDCGEIRHRHVHSSPHKQSHQEKIPGERYQSVRQMKSQQA